MDTIINQTATNLKAELNALPKKNTKAAAGNTKAAAGNTKASAGNTKAAAGNTKVPKMKKPKMNTKRKPMKAKRNQTKKVGSKNQKNRSLVGQLPDFDNSASEIKMSKTGLRKVLKALFSDIGLSDKEILKLLKNLGKDEQSVQNLTKFINKTKEEDLKKKADIIRNMNALKDNILSIYKLSDELNNNLGILFERKNPSKK